ncbi:MAG TPA: hypothetical protein PLJ48_08290, partial [Dermatophilaceae bacterium]|nr:hypothetical protein [Dermatophilaceae bacterium]
LVIVVFMCVYYMMFGVFSSVALGVNLLLLVAVLSMLQATLTLPGMAAMALVSASWRTRMAGRPCCARRSTACASSAIAPDTTPEHAGLAWASAAGAATPPELADLPEQAQRPRDPAGPVARLSRA